MANNEKSEMTFLEHLEELRWHLVRSALVILAGAIVAFVFKYVVFDIIILGPSRDDFITNELLCRFGRWFNQLMVEMGREGGNPDILCLNSEPIKLQNVQMAGQFTAHIKISLIFGLVIGFPYIVFEIWRFVSPALYQNEKKYARAGILAVSLLFFTGVLFGYFLIAPLSVNFLINYKTSDIIVNQPHLMSYVSIVSSISLAGGVVFELPAIIFFLAKIGVVTPEFLKKYRRHAIIILLIVSAIITPPDIFSQILVCIPLLLLYEASILISKKITAKNKQQENADVPVQQ
ncbi:MAG: twin-arginine translocase subunit TatC [Bacteroidales bacterium]|nr:twin-arginine translocase subunit TatC [Bacteroidales bacterium]